jgi:hypothetical protein
MKFFLALVQATLSSFLLAADCSEFNEELLAEQLSFSRLSLRFPNVIGNHDMIGGWYINVEKNEDYPSHLKVFEKYMNNSTDQESTVKPKSRLLREIFGETAKKNSFQMFTSDFFNVIIPSSAAKQTIQDEGFNFFSQLNALELSLPSSYFLNEGQIYKNLKINKQSNKLDTALSKEGLKHFIEFYGQSRDVFGKVYENNEDFKADLNDLIELADKNPIVILLQLDKTKRHSSGVVLKKNKEAKLIAYIFDTMGIDLPARPCGYRYENTKNKGLIKTISILKNKQILPIITPINLRISLQKDFYSCLFATVLFFEAIIKDEIVSINDFGYTEVFGDVYVIKELLPSEALPVYYAIKYLPLLAGVQSDLALFLMIDCLDEKLFSKLAKARSNWNRLSSQESIVTERKNIFWQAGYLSFLAWFDSCYKQNKPLPFPDFEVLALSGDENRNFSELEIVVNELSEDIKNSNEIENLLEKRFYNFYRILYDKLFPIYADFLLLYEKYKQEKNNYNLEDALLKQHKEIKNLVTTVNVEKYLSFILQKYKQPLELTRIKYPETNHMIVSRLITKWFSSEKNSETDDMIQKFFLRSIDNLFTGKEDLYLISSEADSLVKKLPIKMAKNKLLTIINDKLNICDIYLHNFRENPTIDTLVELEKSVENNQLSADILSPILKEISDLFPDQPLKDIFPSSADCHIKSRQLLLIFHSLWPSYINNENFIQTAAVMHWKNDIGELKKALNVLIEENSFSKEKEKAINLLKKFGATPR